MLLCGDVRDSRRLAWRVACFQKHYIVSAYVSSRHTYENHLFRATVRELDSIISVETTTTADLGRAD